MSRIINLRAMVIDALLEEGAEICAARFAASRGLEPNSVARVLRDLSEHLNKRPAPKEPGKHRVYYSACDRDALLRIRNAPRVGSNQYGSLRSIGISFDELLTAWGIATKPIKLSLPTFTHTMYDEPEAA
jgi:hypothetical protein